MKKPRRYLKVKKIVFIICIVVSAMLLINLTAGLILKHRLNAAVFNIKKDTYVLTVSGCYANVFTGYISLKDVKIIEANNAKKNRSNLFSFPFISFSNICIITFLIKKNIHIGEIYAQCPIINFKTDTTNKINANKSFHVLPPGCSELYIKKIVVEKGTISIIANEHHIYANNLTTSVRGIKINTQTERQKNYFDVDEFKAQAPYVTDTLNKGLYINEAFSIKLNSSDSTITCDSLKMHSTIDKREFSKKIGYSTDCIQYTMRGITFTRINLSQLIINQNLEVKKITIAGLHLDIYRDFNVQNVPKLHILPASFLKRIKNEIDVKEIQVHNANFLYQEYAEGSALSGYVFIDSINANLSNLTNTNLNDTISFTGSGLLMGKSKLMCKILLPLSHDQIIGSASLAPTDIMIMNPMAERNAFIKIESGYENSLGVDFIADTIGATGQMKFLYSDLKISLVGKTDYKNKGLLNSIGSLLLNHTFLKESNPDKGNVRIGVIAYTRTSTQSLTNYLIKILLSGIKSSVGLNEKKYNEQIDKQK